MRDKEWVEKVARENYGRILRVAYRRAVRYHIPSPEAWAADMTQSVFLTLSEGATAKALRQHENISAWLLETLYHLMGRYFQKRSSQEIPVADVAMLQEALVSKLLIDDPFPVGLTGGERDLLYRCHCLRIPRKEIAESLGITLGACQMRLERAEEHFRVLYIQQNKIDSSTGIDGIRQNNGRILQKGGAEHA